MARGPGLLAQRMEEERLSGGRRPREVILEEARERVQRLDLSLGELSNPSPQVRARVEEEIRAAIRRYCSQADLHNLPPLSAEGTEEEVLAWVMQRILGLGRLQPLLEDPEVEEIIINAPGVGFFIDGAGKHPFNPELGDERGVIDLVNRLAAPAGRHLARSPGFCRVDVRIPLPDGASARLHATCPPAARDGVYVNIRKYIRRVRGLEELVGLGTLTEEAADFLKGCVRGKLNIVIGGPTGSGKTTLAMALLREAPPEERICVIEEVGEITLDGHPDVVYLETIPPGPEGGRAVTLTDLVRDALRMRPDRIVLGEARGGEVLDVVMAHNTGHSGGICTVHANSAPDTIYRLMDLMLLAGVGLPPQERARLVAQAFHIVVFMVLLRGAGGPLRRVEEIGALDGNVEDSTPRYHALFRRRDGVLQPTGMRPPRRVEGLLRRA